MTSLFFDVLNTILCIRGPSLSSHNSSKCIIKILGLQDVFSIFFEKFLLFFGQFGFFQQIRPVLCSADDGLFSSPLFNVRMMTG